MKVLVSGGGIAGNAVALQLLNAGINTTVVERAATPRPGGQAVDLRGPSREVAERLGLMPGIRKRQLDERGMRYIDNRGREYGRMPAEMFGGKGPVADIEITRGDLNEVLLEQLPETDYRYGEWIQALRQDDTGVDVTFASGHTERFDLVIGADGVHSATRRLACGPEEQFATHLGGYMAYFTIPTPEGMEPGWFTMHAVPGATVGIRPDADPTTAKAMVVIRMDKDPALRRDPAAQQRLIRDKLADAGWVVPEIVAGMAIAPDFYFDELARVDVPNLSVGRVTLLGDAGYCGSPLSGMGTAMALVGSYLLAGEIAATPDNVTGALTRYQSAVTPFLDKAKELTGGGITMMVRHSPLGVALSRQAAKIMVSRPLRPLVMKMFTHTDDFTLPVY